PKRLIKSPKKAKAIFNNAYVNVAPSLYIKEKFEALGYTNISHIPNSIEIQKYKFKQRDFKSINLLWVRSFSKIYNPILAIQVLKSLKDKGIEASLCMVGPDSDGSLQEAKKVATQNNLAVTFTGKLSKDKWIELSKAYSFFINTTNFDNMPVSVIEAMALGMPVISTNVGGIPYLIADKKTGILVSPNQEEEFVNAIKYLIATPEKALAIAENAREFAQQLDWLHIKQKWNALLLHIEE
ncbi:MAG: glycosyltransferase family 4 protein, partial [Oceanihabitans sp.]